MEQNGAVGATKCPQYYKIGDKVEAVKLNIGAWFSADIIDIFPKPICECYDECQCSFKILFESDETKAEIAERKLDEIRQVTYSSLDWDSLRGGMMVVINYNIKNPDQWGYWYDYFIQDVYKRDSTTYVKGILMVGYKGVTDKIPVEINSDKVADVLEIRPHATVVDKEMETYETGVKPEYCKHCKNKPKTRCRKCCCCKCGIKKDFQLTVLCDECADWYHIYCVNPPLMSIPDDDTDWYCPKCNNEVLRAKKEMRLKAKIQQKKNKTKKKETALNVMEKKCEAKPVSIKRQSDVKPEDFTPKLMATNNLTSEIPKNSVIWNDVEKLFPKYEVVRISVEMIVKAKNNNNNINNNNDNDNDNDNYYYSVLNPTLERLIYGDEINEHIWSEARERIKDGKEVFLEHVRKLFTCSICCELMKEPITLSCKHSFCIKCFFKALSVNVYNCALCRTDVIHTEHYLVNENLSKALELLFQK